MTDIVSDVEDIWDDILDQPWATRLAVRLGHPLDRYSDALRQFPTLPMLLAYLLVFEEALLPQAVDFYKNTLDRHPAYSPEDERLGIELLLKRLRRVWQFRGVFKNESEKLAPSP